MLLVSTSGLYSYDFYLSENQTSYSSLLLELCILWFVIFDFDLPILFYVWFFYPHIYVLFTCLLSYGWIQTTMWVLGLEPWSAVGAIGAYKPVSHLFSPTFQFLGVGLVTKQTKFLFYKVSSKKVHTNFRGPGLLIQSYAGHNPHCERSCSRLNPALRRKISESEVSLLYGASSRTV